MSGDSLAAVCILTLAPTSPLNRRMNASFNLAPSSRIVLRWCLFADEGKPWHHAIPTTVVLKRPEFVTADKRYQCVAKILAWLHHAQTAFSRASFVGWMDSDTWVLPQRLESYLDGVAADLPPATHASWIGLAMHWSRFDYERLDGMGFMHTPNPAQEKLARRLFWDHRENLRHLDRHQRALGVDPARSRNMSFAMTQGCFTLFSRAALTRLLSYALAPVGPQRAFLATAAAHELPAGSAGGSAQSTRVGSGGSTRVAAAAKPGGKCVLPTDVGLGWLMTHAYAGRHDLHVVNFFGLLELFVWESARVNAQHTLVAHLAQSKNGDYAKTLSFYEGAVHGGRAPLKRPRLRCAKTGWTHTAAKHWRECVNVAHCEGLDPSVPPPPPPPPPPLVPEPERRRKPPPPLTGWLPAGARETCKLWHRAKGYS